VPGSVIRAAPGPPSEQGGAILAACMRCAARAPGREERGPGGVQHSAAHGRDMAWQLSGARVVGARHISVKVKQAAF